MWFTTPFVKLQAAISDFLAFSFHTCMFQAERKKDTAIWTSVPQLQSALERKCDGNHSHKPWGLVGPNEFATAEECAYNVELARTWAQAIADYAIACNVVPEPQTFDEARSHHAKTTKLNQALLGLLPRGRKIPPLMCDFLQPQTFDVSEMPALQKLAPKMRIPDSVTAFPKGSRVLRFHSNGAGGVDGHESVDGQNTGLPKFAAIGIPREPWDFVAEAIKLTHPVLQRMRVPKIIEEAIDLHSFDPVGLRRRHVEFGQWVVSAAKEVQEEQKTIINDMPVHCRRVLEGKNIALFNRLIHFHSYPDVDLAMQMARGFPLYGWMPASGVFQGQVRLPELQQGALKAMAKSYTQRTLAAVKGSGCADLDAALWTATMSEVSDGYIIGPFEPSAVPIGAIVAPRFALQQKNKIRPIDDFTAAGTNLAVGMHEKLAVDTIDECAGIIKAWMQRFGAGLELVGKCYDLRKAYRQLAVCEDHLHASWVAVWNPELKRPQVFQMDSLPFGATGSVAAFLRVSQALKVLGTAGPAIVWSAFYDNFICICKKGDEQAVDRVVRFFFSSLGWKLSSDADKDLPFSKSFAALGVVFDLSDVHSGSFTIGNTEKRKSEIEGRIDDILARNVLSPAESMSLRSRLTFAEAQIFGRGAKLALHCIGGPGRSGRTLRPLDEDIVFHLKWMKERIVQAPPRRVEVLDRDTVYIFLDGACTCAGEEDGDWTGTSIGGVLVDKSGNPISHFGFVIPEDIVSTWGPADKQQYIFEAEVLPFAVALHVWRRELAGKCLFVFIDNEAAMGAWISGNADSRVARKILHNGAMMESLIDAHPYFARVPTHSNVGDDPSRGKFEELLRLGSKQVHVDRDLILEITK